MKYLAPLGVRSLTCTLLLVAPLGMAEAQQHELSTLELIDGSNGASIPEANLSIVMPDSVTTRWRGSWPLEESVVALRPGERCYVHSSGFEVMTLSHRRLLANPLVELMPVESEPATLSLSKSVDLSAYDVTIQGGLACGGNQWKRADASLRFRSPIAVPRVVDARDLPASFSVPSGTELRLGLFCKDAILAPDYVSLVPGSRVSIEAIPFRKMTLKGVSPAEISASFMTPDTRFDQGFGETARGPLHRFIAMPKVARLNADPEISGWTHVPPIRTNVLYQVNGALYFLQLPEGTDDMEVDLRDQKPITWTSWETPLPTGPGVFLPGHLELSSALLIREQLHEATGGAIELEDAGQFTGTLPWRSHSTNFTFFSDSGRVAHGSVDAAGTASLRPAPGTISLEFGGGARFSGIVRLESRWSPFDGITVKASGREFTRSWAHSTACTFGSVPLGTYLVHAQGELEFRDGSVKPHAERRWVTLTPESTTGG